MIPGRTVTTKATEEALFAVQSKDDGCFAHDGYKEGKWCYWSIFLRYMTSKKEVVEVTEIIVGLSNACERKRKMNYKESVIMIYTSGFQTPAFGIGLS